MYFCDEHRGITRYYEILKSSVCEKYQLRQMEYDILMFLYNNPHITRQQILSDTESQRNLMYLRHLRCLRKKG